MRKLKYKKIAIDNIQSKIPVGFYIALYLLMDKFHAPEWGWTIFILFIIIQAINVIYENHYSDFIDIFVEKDENA